MSQHGGLILAGTKVILSTTGTIKGGEYQHVSSPLSIGLTLQSGVL